MSGADLGGGRCQQCGGPITGKGRRDRKYCSASCRTVAWGQRAGRDTGKASNGSGAVKLDDLLVNRLADALLSRLAGASTGPDPRVGNPPALVPTPVAHVDLETVHQLRGELNQLRAELERSRAVPQAAQDPARVATSVRPLEGGTASPPSLSAPNAPRSSFRLLVGQEAAARGIAVVSPLERLMAAHQEELAAKDADHARLTREYSARSLAHHKLEMTLENAATEKQSLSKRIRDLERQCEAAKAETEAIRKQLQSLRQVLSEEDPLLFLMRSKVNLQHQIAVGRESMGSHRHGRRLPDEKPETRQAAAVYAAYAARQEYFASCADSRKGKATWIVEGRRLDPISEQKLRKQEDEMLGKLERELSLTTRLREGR